MSKEVISEGIVSKYGVQYLTSHGDGFMVNHNAKICMTRGFLYVKKVTGIGEKLILCIYSVNCRKPSVYTCMCIGDLNIYR